MKRSRAKTKAKVDETSERVNNLKSENEELETKIKILSKELQLLKDMFVSHAGREPFASNLNRFMAIKGLDQAEAFSYDAVTAQRMLQKILNEEVKLNFEEVSKSNQF